MRRHGYAYALVLVVAALSCLLVPKEAHARGVYWCINVDCSYGGGDLPYMDEAQVSGLKTMICRGATGLEPGQTYPYCEAGGGELMWALVDELTAADWILTSESYSPMYSADTFAFYQASSGGGGGDDEPFDPADIDFDKAGGAFGAAFILCGLFWGLGKTAGMFTRLVRRA